MALKGHYLPTFGKIVFCIQTNSALQHLAISNVCLNLVATTVGGICQEAMTT
jgi:hypothetical protein